jgi:hypothetical protein
MAGFTENMARDFLSITKDDGGGKHAPFTVWEETQLLHAWLKLQEARELLKRVDGGSNYRLYQNPDDAPRILRDIHNFLHGFTSTSGEASGDR